MFTHHNNNSIDEYISSISNNSERAQYVDYILKGNSSIIYNQIKYSTLCTFTIILFVLFIIFCITLLIFIKQKCCLFNQRFIFDKYSKLSYLLTLLIFMPIIIFSFILYINIHKISIALIDSKNNFDMMIDIYMNGNANETSRNQWSGFSSMAKFLNQGKTLLYIFNNNSSNIFEENKNLQVRLNDLNDTIGKLNYYYFLNVTNPSNKSNIMIKPLYAKEFNGEDNNTLLNEITQEIESSVLKSTILNEIKKDRDYLITNDIKITESITTMNNTISSFKDFILNIKRIIGENYLYPSQKKIQNLLLITQISFGLSLLIIIFSIVGLSIYKNVKDKGVATCTHVLMLILLLCIVILLICCISFSIIGFSTNKSITSIGYLLSEDYINNDKCVLTEDKDNGYYLNVCLNKNGELSNSINMNNENINLISSFISTLNENFAQFSMLQQTKSLQKAKKVIESYLEDYSNITDSSYGENDVLFILEKINELTNNVKNQSEGCQTYDIWVKNKESCPKDYIYYTKGEILEQRIKEEKYCLIIQDEYSYNDLIGLYSEYCKEKLAREIIIKLNSLSEFYLNNMQNLNEILNNIQKGIENYNEIVEKYNTQSKQLFKLVKHLILGFSLSFVTNNMNCGFSKQKLLNMFDNIYLIVGNYSKSLCKILISCCVLDFLGVLAIQYTMVKNSKRAKKLSGKAEILKGIELKEKKNDFQDNDDDDDDDDEDEDDDEEEFDTNINRN